MEKELTEKVKVRNDSLTAERDGHSVGRGAGC